MYACTVPDCCDCLILLRYSCMFFFFFFNGSATPEIYTYGHTLSLHDALPIANNASVGGALVPLVALGIPGSVIDAILLAALVMHGISPGPLLYTTNPALIYAIIVTCLVATIMMFLLMTGARSEEHTSELQSLMRISYAVFCLKKKRKIE